MHRTLARRAVMSSTLPAYRFSSAVFKYRDAWAIVVRGNYVFDRKSGPSHRLDLTFKQIGDAAARSLPHGIIGQSFSTNGPRHGKQDVYPSSGRIATSAMAEGAIEGDAAMYEVARPYATEFAFSRFMSAAPARRLRRVGCSSRARLPRPRAEGGSASNTQQDFCKACLSSLPAVC